MGLRDALKSYWQYAGQPLTGLAETTLANDARPNETGITVAGYRPAIVDQLPATYGALKSIITGRAPAPGSFVANSMDRTALAAKRSEDFFGVKPPQNAVQQALNIAGTVLVPGPKLPVSASAIGKVARVAAEVALPLRQTGLKTALASAVPVGVGLREGIDHIADDPDYQHIGEAPHVADEFPDHLGSDEFPSHVAQVPQPEFPDTIQAPAADLSADSHALTWQEKGILGAIALGGIAWGSSITANGLKRIRNVPDVGSELSGTRVISPRDNTVQKGIGAVLQADQPARNAASQFLTHDEAKQFNYSSDRIVNQAIGAKVHHTIQTGEFPNSSVVAPTPLAPVLQAVSKDLNPAEFNALTDGLLAKSSLDDYTRTGIQSSFNDKSPTELKSMADIVDNDPKLSKYAGAIQQQYATLLDYMHDKGLVSSESYQQMKADRPNYVHMSRDVVREGGPTGTFGSGASSKVDELFNRADEEFGGVQVSATRNPIDELQNRYASVIKLAELNDHKRDFLGKLANSGAANELVPTSDGSSVKLIQRLDDAPKTTEGVVPVWENGRQQYYKIGDPALERSMQYAPRATMPVLGQMRQIAQFFTTGAGNVTSFFGATVSPVFDATLGNVLRPAGTDIGLINEALNKMGVPRGGVVGERLRTLDPTIPFTPWIGGLRSMKDEITGALATNLSDQLLRDHGWLLDKLGATKVTNLRDFLQNSYDNSYRSMLDEQGVGSHMGYGSDNGRDVPTGLVNVAPDYVKAARDRADYATLNSGDITRVKRFMLDAGNDFTHLKASTIARMYTGVLRNMSEGYKYQFAATNNPKTKSMAQLAELMSQTRRLAGDSAQGGSSDGWNKIADSVMYANLSTQTLGEIGRKFGKAPIHTTLNLLSTIGMLTALRYGGIISDPRIAQKTADKTDMQNTASISTFGGAELPVAPELRPITGPLFALLDQVSGVANGIPDPNFAKAIYKYFDDDAPTGKEMQEGIDQASKDSFFAGLSAANPINPAGSPIGALVEASAGIDPNMSRVTGNATPIKPQTVDPLAGEGKTTDSMLSAYWENILTSVTGSAVINAIHVADDFQRAAFARNADGSRGISPAGAVKVALSRIVDDTARTKSPIQGMLFKDYTPAKSIADTDYKLMQAKNDGMDKAKSILKQDILEPFVTGTDPRTAMLKPIDLVPQDLSGTQLAPIGAITAELLKSVRPIQLRTGQISKAIETVRSGQKITTIEARNKQINELNDERKYLGTLQLRATRMAEDQIEKVLGEPFSYQHFDPQQYKKPFVLQQQN